MTPVKFRSISKAFICGLAKVTSFVVVLFSCVVLYFNARATHLELQEQMDRLIKLSQTSLASALWQYNNDYIKDYVESLFLYKDVVFVKVDTEHQTLKAMTRSGYNALDFVAHTTSAKFIRASKEITYENNNVGEITIVITKERIKFQILYGGLILISLLLILNGLIFLTVYGLSQKHFFVPLKTLEKSAKDIAEGSLETDIDTSGEGEIGRLANTFKLMIDNIKTVTAGRDELNHEIRVRKEFETALKTSQETLLSVLDGIDATVYVADLETYEILFMNKFMVNLYEKDLKGERCYEAFRNETRPCSFCSNNILLNHEGRPTGVHIWSDKNPITGRWFMNHDRAIKWIDGRYVRLQIATDVTELKEMENELRQAHKMESIGRLAGGIAHDFNNILAAINGFSQLALESLPEGSQAADDIREVVNSSNRAAKLVKQILSFSRKQPQELVPIKLQDILTEAIQLLRATIPATILIKEQIETSCGAVMADPTMLHQVVINLCTNGAHAMEDSGGILEISLASEYLASRNAHVQHSDLTPGHYAKLQIRDSGTGIPEDDLERIFDPYFTTKDIGKGSGMGLAVVHGVVQNHRGTIEVESTVGEGSTFTVYLPSVEAKEQSLPDSGDTLPTGSESILLVDDEERIVRLTKRRLEKLGYFVTSTTKSTEALEYVIADPDKYDMVISDQTMPTLRGDQLAEAIKEIRPGLPIIICSGYASRLDQKIIGELGISSVLMKPVEHHELAQAVRRGLDTFIS